MKKLFLIITLGIHAITQPQQRSQPPVRVPADRILNYKNFTFYQQGDLPILISAPHGGQKKIGVPARVGGINPLKGNQVRLFATVLDAKTLELAQQVSDNLYRLLGKRPYLVAADFTRKEIDANRPPEDAYENAAAKKIYDQYHDIMQQYVNEIKKRFGDKAILIDIHGQGLSPNTIYRGTSNRKNVTRLINRDGEVAFTGPNSVVGILGTKGYTVSPGNNETNTPEASKFIGGYIVRHYGSNNKNGIDAIQLESGSNLRKEANIPRYASDLAEAISGFYGTYLTQQTSPISYKKN